MPLSLPGHQEEESCRVVMSRVVSRGEMLQEVSRVRCFEIRLQFHLMLTV